MSWLSEMQLRDMPEGRALELTCLRCRYIWIADPTAILVRIEHDDIYLDEVAKNLTYPLHGYRHTGVRLQMIRTDDTSDFVSELV